MAARDKMRAGAYMIATPSVRIANRHYTHLCPATGRPLTLSWFDAPWFEMMRRMVKSLRRSN